MSWYAKPYGSYAIDSNEAKSNMIEIYNTLKPLGFTDESISGVIGNCYSESGLNPWRWQSDFVDDNNGYGLYQYTPATSYLNGAINIEGYSPNLSVSSQTNGATPEDGKAQTLAFANNTLGKWIGDCWSPLWDESEYPELYQFSRLILNAYGYGSILTLNQYKTITDITSATFAFLACYERPSVPNPDSRYDNARIAYQIITGLTPPTPTPIPTKKKMPLWFYLRPYF